jgi:signal transduction histidine kinase
MFHARKSLYRDLKGDKYVVGVIRDITDLKQKELMLVQQNRQAALGEMLDHIAHQWRQPLNSISVIIGMLELTASGGESTNEHIEETVSKITALLGHMAQTIDVFRDFYRPEKEKTAFRLKDSIDMSLDFIAPSLRFHAITAELDVNPSLVALGYSKEYAQVLLNLLGNAKNALVERKINNPRIQVTAFAEDKEAVVTITDNAGGIPASDMDRIFEPLFTTRKETGGTGVGLYMSKSIIEKNMGGTLSAANVDGGAQFRIEVPAS